MRKRHAEYIITMTELAQELGRLPTQSEIGRKLVISRQSARGTLAKMKEHGLVKLAYPSIYEPVTFYEYCKHFVNSK